jgi:hypothetical protein
LCDGVFTFNPWNIGSKLLPFVGIGFYTGRRSELPFPVTLLDTADGLIRVNQTEFSDVFIFNLE